VHPEHVRQLFDTKAATWSAKYGPGGRLTDRLTQFSTAVSGHVSAEGHILDLGCGTGDLARAMAAKGMRVTGCDISAEMLRHAAAADHLSSVEWVRLDPGWRTLPFDFASFDAVIAASVLEYVADPAAVLGECARVLRSRGVVLCTVPDCTRPIRWLEWLVATATRKSQIRAVGHRWPQLDQYLTYLRISRQRHSATWWSAVAAKAGLRTVSDPAGAVERSPLRLLAFQLTD